jgi:hypothetical protein
VSSGIVGQTQTVTQQGAGFNLNTDELDTGKLGSVRVLSRDSELSGYDPHSSITVSQNVSAEWFRIRRIVQVYKDLGIKRKRKAGVE